MSGGTFGYQQYRLLDMAETIDEVIREAIEWDYDWPDDVIARMRETQQELRTLEKKLTRIDWLAAGDDGVDAFRRRWAEEGLD